MTLYLDASILVALIQPERGSEAAARLVATATAPLLISDLARGEVVSSQSRQVRMGELAEHVALARLSAFAEWVSTTADTIATESRDVSLAVQFVSHFRLGLRMPDAIHLAATRNREATLATADDRVMNAAEALGIDVAR